MDADVTCAFLFSADDSPVSRKEKPSTSRKFFLIITLIQAYFLNRSLESADSKEIENVRKSSRIKKPKKPASLLVQVQKKNLRRARSSSPESDKDEKKREKDKDKPKPISEIFSVHVQTFS